MTERDDSAQGFLGRWSRKKIEAEREASAPPAPPAADPAGTDTAADRSAARPEPSQAADATTAPPEFDLTKLPSLESITAGTDIRAFLAPGVPTAIARAALRRAWATDLAIRDFKGLAENDWDFTDPASMPGFGNLPPGYDVKKLLAQIVGDVKSPNEHAGSAPVHQTEPQPEPVAVAKVPSRAIEDGNSNAPGSPADPPAPAEEVVVQRTGNLTSHRDRADDESEGRQNRRRHGGALPQ